jgi:uncharacterized protein (UPF0261 family)
MAVVLIIGTMDTKGLESQYLADSITALGCKPLTLDSGILGEADGIVPDISRSQVAEAAGSTIDALRNAGSRGKAVEGMLVGVRRVAKELCDKEQIHGVVALGGAEGSVLATAAMKALPLGVPKLIVSPIASGTRQFGPFVGIKDIMVMHSIVDILGLNNIALQVFDNAAAAISGMAKSFAEKRLYKNERNQIAATMLGNTTAPLMQIRKQLEQDGNDLVLFHANGVGGVAMEDLFEQGVFQGVIDYTLSELAGEIIGGFHGGTERLHTAGKLGLPQVIVPGCVDFGVFGSPDNIPEALQERPTYYHNPEFTLVRLSCDEQIMVARNIAKRLNNARGKVSMIVPLQGLSIPNHAEGGEFWDPDCDASFREVLKDSLDNKISYREIDAHINDEVFIKAVMDEANSHFNSVTPYSN